jgi:crotonobetainyl-CoA:carnitine CoA-transferase CaiB-like acyl-CoA transferase
MTQGCLDGITIADFSRVLAGPYATMLLGDLGAQVIKVERPGAGDDTRHWHPPTDQYGRATYFEAVNRNKTSVCLDLRSPSGQSRARELALTSDVVVENFPPGTMARFGLDYPTLCGHSPRLVYCSVTGFGREQGAGLPGYDLLVQAVGGLMSITGPEPGHPTKVGVALVDVLTGLHATVGILAALRHRDATGEGQWVEVNLLSSLLSGLVNQASAVVGAGAVPGIMGNAHPSIAPYSSFHTADRDIVIAVGNDKQFAALCDLLGRPDLATDPLFATNPQRVAHRAALEAELNATLSLEPAAHWLERCAAAGVPAGPINDIGEAVALATDLGLQPVVEVEGRQQVANPIQFSRTPASYRHPPPALPDSTSDHDR